MVKKDERRKKADSPTLTHIRQLAWTGQHAAAIDSATEALDRKADWQSAPQIISLLDLRSESYIALGKLDLAMKDAKAMMKIAKGGASGIGNRKSGDSPQIPIPKSQLPALHAQALNRLALVQMRTGDLNGALKSANTAVKASANRQSSIENRQSLALAHFRLAEAQFRTQKNEAAIENAQTAVDIYLSLGDLSGAGRAYWALANGYTQSRQIEKRDEALHKALAYCQQVGDNYGLGNALNTISVTEVDITKAFRTFQQSIEAFEKAGYLDRIQIPKANLAVTYLELGLYSHAARLQGEVLEANRRMNAKVGFIYALGNIAGVYIALGQFETALSHQKEFTILVETLGDPNMENQAEANWADLKFNTGDIKAALRHQKVALRIVQQHQLGIEVTALTELGKMQLANGDLVNALKTTTKATTLHRAEGFAKQDSFTQQAIWWRHTQALLANKKNKEAQEALNRAYDFLLESIGNIRDEGLRRNALNKVTENRELIQYWVADGTKRKLPKERLFAYLNIESNLREPFQRLADTGLRLNALKSIEAIQTFLVEEATELIGGERVMLILERQTSEFLENSEVYVADSLLPRGEDASAVLKSISKHLTQARLTRTVQLILPKKSGLNRIISPLIAQNQILGYLYVDMDSLYGSFDDTDRDMLGMLANQGAVALDNAQWAQGLERKVEERTEELNQRVDELAILNSVGEAMA
ncbi:MAG TPA: hypothetical protein PK414_08685, partial [Anaerolineales bacterium]|nr:hypothetical protein [Anaerolineales bacterium]